MLLERISIMIEIIGQFNTAKCFTGQIEELASNQIKTVCDTEAFASSKIRIMPDVHAGKGCTIGTTMTITDKIVPGMVGVDIGCGMETVRLKERELDFAKLDELIRRKIPSGRAVRTTAHKLSREIDLNQLRCKAYVDLDRAPKSIGTLGGGNHFIEVDRGENDALYLVVHSGSRHLGNEVARYYQNAAAKSLKDHREMGFIPKDLAYVQGKLFEDYIHDMRITQRFAALNRKAMLDVMLSGMGLTAEEQFSTIHNYIDTENMILRKGAVSAQAGEKLLIPINMRDGSLICIGKGNPEWNCSAPHGAGRLMSRKDAAASLNLEEYRRQMDGIYTSCISRSTLDEAPMAYKSMDEILSQIGPTVEVLQQIRPVYNFKAGE